jgi:hypothetical protein
MVRDIVLAVMSSLAKVERQKISERTKAGLARVRAKGTRLGRPAIGDKVQARIATLARDNPAMTPYAHRQGCRVRREDRGPSMPTPHGTSPGRLDPAQHRDQRQGWPSGRSFRFWQSGAGVWHSIALIDTGPA